ncbi:MAG TPA: phenylalanine--tRNA ligase subunit beta [Candidatus Paceibacterota bacterium]|nr:phenylalanine--tRNA ligase subunit beta [Candidatus Paceibacterota bacterium]
MKVSYNWLQNYFKEKLPEPEKISEGIVFHSFEVEEVEKIGNDTIFDIKILPDRAHDCLSHWGIAKEISAIFDIKIKDKVYKIFSSQETKLDIKIENEKCLRYMGRIFKNIKIAESPDWLKECLNTIGQKSINNVVDSANFVMFDLGQPIHCFDLDKLASEKIIVRNGKIGEKITTLDKKNIELDESILVIADENNPLAIAGIKGGVKAEVDENTKNIVIEVANFNPTTTRKTAKKINILTDAVKRYENEISPELCEKVMNAISDLIYSLAGGEAENIVDIYPNKKEQKNISLSVDYVNKRLGSNFSKYEIESVWKKLNFLYTEKDNIFQVEIPFLRLDLNGKHDLTEEVIRILGYEKLSEVLPKLNMSSNESSFSNNIFSKMFLARRKLLDDGYSEVMTYTFRDNGEVEVLASASDKKFLRTNLADGLKESLKLNQLNAPFLGMKEIKIFEIGTVFLKDKEEMHVAYNEKENIKEISLDEFCKSISDIDSTNIFNEKENNDTLNFSSVSVFKQWSIYPFICRDIAIWVMDKEDEKKIKNLIIENGTDLLIKEPYIFDSFSNPKTNKTSFGFRLIFQSYDRTLTDEEVNKIMLQITNKISENKEWQVR